MNTAIIGGADGPTKIFLTNSGASWGWALGLGIILIAAGFVFYFIKKKH